MKPVYPAAKVRDYIWNFVITAFLAFYATSANAQSCPLATASNINSYPNTYYPASQATVNAGAKSITLGAVTNGSTPISSGDVLLIIQMQGAQINATNNSNYGANTGTGSGYLSNTALLAGNMEYVVATNSVPLTGGTLNILSGLTNKYQNTPFGTDGQYTYQVIRVPVYYDLTLTGNITAPRWDGASGGVVVLYATDIINMAGYTVDASGLGFRGGGGRAFTGAATGSSTDFVTTAGTNANGGKGEGIAGMPKYLNNNNSFLDVSTYEGYPNGSYGRGAPGNAGGGGTDGNPANNAENDGGGGGSNGGAGGQGGNSWSSNLASGGRAGSIFSQASPSRLVMGGGGGAGTTNDATGTPGGGFASSGSAGGGIIIMVAGNMFTGTGTIKSNGTNANSTVKNDGSGGAGAGGSILIFSKNGGTSNLVVQAKGGIGGSNQLTTIDPHGPGGGGGGGVIYSNSTLNASSSVAGGAAGTTNKGTSNYGATPGSAGILSQTITQSQTPTFPLVCVTLAVDFINVAAAKQDGTTNLSWQVSNENSNTKEYIVERSVDGINYTGIAHVSYQAHTSSVNTYEYKDNENIVGTSAVYYRIKMVSVSGNGQYSKTVSVLMNGLTAKLTVFPNPAKTSATVSFVASGSGDVSLRLFDLKGSAIWQKQTRVAAGNNSILLDQIANIPNGIYILQWFDGLKPQQVKLVVNH